MDSALTYRSNCNHELSANLSFYVISGTWIFTTFGRETFTAITINIKLKTDIVSWVIHFRKKGTMFFMVVILWYAWKEMHLWKKICK